MHSALIISLIASVFAIAYGMILIGKINRKPAGNETMREIAKAIQEGASAYLNRQYRTIAIIAVALFVALWLSLGIAMALGFLVGAAFSALAGYIGMNVAVRANVRTAEAARNGMAAAMNV
ncbi:MAG: membrane-bound proton-translocating pyrophosphatase, partial [uncultured bacterium]